MSLFQNPEDLDRESGAWIRRQKALSADTVALLEQAAQRERRQLTTARQVMFLVYFLPVVVGLVATGLTVLLRVLLP